MVNPRRRIIFLWLALFCWLYGASAMPAPRRPSPTPSLSVSSSITYSITGTTTPSITESPTHQLNKRACNKKRDGTSPDVAGYWWDCTTTTTKTKTTTTSDCGPTSTSDAVEASDPYGKGIEPQLAVVSAVCLALGLYLMLFGFSMCRTTVAAGGFIAGNILTWVLLNLAQPVAGYPHQAVLYICVCFAVGFVFAGVAIVCWRKATYFLGALGAFVLSIYIWSWRSDFVLINPYARYFTSLGFAVAGILGILSFERATVILSTAILGAYLFILGIDLLAHTYFVNGPRALLNANHRYYVNYVVDNRVYAMLGAILALILVSVIWQKVATRGRRFGLDLAPA